MNGFHINTLTKIAAWTIALIIVSLNAKLVFDEIQGWLTESKNPMVLWVTVVPLAIGFLILLLYIVIKPFLAKQNIPFKIIRHIIWPCNSMLLKRISLKKLL